MNRPENIVPPGKQGRLDGDRRSSYGTIEQVATHPLQPSHFKDALSNGTQSTSHGNLHRQFSHRQDYYYKPPEQVQHSLFDPNFRTPDYSAHPMSSHNRPSNMFTPSA